MLIISSLTRPYSLRSIKLTPRIFARFSLSSRSSLRSPPCVAPCHSQSLSLRTQHLSHPHPLSRCASLLTSLTPPAGLQIHCRAMDLLSSSLLLSPQFPSTTLLTCHATLLLCAAAGSICTTQFALICYSSAPLSRSFIAFHLPRNAPLCRPAAPLLACGCLRLFAGCRC